jgi:NADH:ubiquinone oxidoreductase subunit C
MASDEIMKSLEAKLTGVVYNMTAPRERRIFAETTPEKLVEVTRLLKEWSMINIGTITGLDAGDRFEVIYHFYNSQGLLYNLKVFIPRNNPKIPSVSSVFPGVFLYERELMDLFGIIVEGTPPGLRYPLPDHWPEGQYPLRKDWKGLVTETEVKFHE